MYWSRTDSCILSLISELPPIATMAVRSPMSVSPRQFSVSSSVQRERHHGLLAVQAVLGLVEDHGVRAVDDRIRHFDAAVGGQRVHVDGVLVRHRHPPLVCDPVRVLVNDRRPLALVGGGEPVSYTHLRAHETVLELV